MINKTISPSRYKTIPIWIAMSHACLCTGFISANFSVSLTPGIDTRIFPACLKRLVRTLLDQGFRYGLLCRKFKQFYRPHHSLIQRYSHSVMQHLREGVDSQVRWWPIRILLVGAVVTGTDRLSIYSFTGVLLSFFSFLYFYRFSEILYFLFLFPFISFILYIFNLFADFFLSFFLSSFFLSFFKFPFFYSLSLLISCLLSFSSEYAFL